MPVPPAMALVKVAFWGQASKHGPVAQKRACRGVQVRQGTGRHGSSALLLAGSHVRGTDSTQQQVTRWVKALRAKAFLC